MSLRYQINRCIFLAALIILLLGGWLTIWQARSAVNQEVDASINLAVQLIELSLSQESNSSENVKDWLPQLAMLKATRHLHIQLKQATGEWVQVSKQRPELSSVDLPPAWFINWVGQSYPEAEYPLIKTSGIPLSLIIQANPLDEITEVWQESLLFFGAVLLLTLISFIGVHLVFQRSFIAIQQIVTGLQSIESGKYSLKLPEFAIQEYADIAQAVNHMTAKLQQVQTENSALTKHSLAVQEEERQYLAQELHDELGQSLTAIKVMAVTAAHPKSDTQEITQAITEVCEHLMQVVRGMMYQLHPLVLTELGLKASLEDMLVHWQARSPQLKFTMACEERVHQLDSSVAIQVFRVIQECLTNTVRHAQAQQVKIEITWQGEQLQLAVSDDGLGCDLEKKQKGFGLRGMQERIYSLGGEIELYSSAGTGFKMVAKIPLTTQEKK